MLKHLKNYNRRIWDQWLHQWSITFINTAHVTSQITMSSLVRDLISRMTTVKTEKTMMTVRQRRQWWQWGREDSDDSEAKKTVTMMRQKRQWQWWGRKDSDNDEAVKSKSDDMSRNDNMTAVRLAIVMICVKNIVFFI